MITNTFFSEIKILHDTSTQPETPMPGLKCGHDIAPIAAPIKISSVLQSSQEAEHKVTSNGKDENTSSFCPVSMNAYSVDQRTCTGKANHNAKLIPYAVDFDTTGIRNTKFEIETIKSSRFLLLFTSWQTYKNRGK